MLLSCRACGNALKRLNALSVQQQSIGNASDILRVNQSADRLAKYRQEIAQMQEPLLTGFLVSLETIIVDNS